MAEERKFAREEVRRYDGRDGRPAYITYKGRVYDVSASFLWQGGRHQALHTAGADLTEALKQAPHGADLLGRVKLVGILLED